MKGRGIPWIVIAGAAFLLLVVAAGVTAWQARLAGENRASVDPNSPAPDDAVGVVVESAQWREFRQVLKTSGSIYAVRFALVSARIPGTLDDVFVREGDRVEAGVTKLFQTDSLKLSKALAIAQENLKVAEFALREKEALREKTVVAKQQAERDLQRYEELLRSNGVSQQMVEHQRALVQQLTADLKHVDTLIDLARAQLEQARLSVTIAEKDLADSLVYAPISGVVEDRYREPGEMAGAGTPVVKISDPSLLEARAVIPQEYYAAVIPGQTKMIVRVGSRELPPLDVSYKSPTVDFRSRTFEVRCRITSPPEDVVPGAMAEVTLVLQSRQGVGVPLDAVVQMDGRPVVFAVENDRAKRVDVRLGLRGDGFYEVLEGLTVGTPVVVSGQSRLSDGARLRVLTMEKPGSQPLAGRLISQPSGV